MSLVGDPIAKETSIPSSLAFPSIAQVFDRFFTGCDKSRKWFDNPYKLCGKYIALRGIFHKKVEIGNRKEAVACQEGTRGPT
jgi:hypothetical protein